MARSKVKIGTQRNGRELIDKKNIEGMTIYSWKCLICGHVTKVHSSTPFKCGCKTKKARKEMDKEVVKLLEQGLTPKKIGEILNVTPAKIQYVACKTGNLLRNRKGEKINIAKEMCKQEKTLKEIAGALGLSESGASRFLKRHNIQKKPVHRTGRPMTRFPGDINGYRIRIERDVWECQLCGVRKLIRPQNLYRPCKCTKTIPPEIIEKAKEMKKEGYTVSELARRLNLSAPKIRLILKKSQASQ